MTHGCAMQASPQKAWQALGLTWGKLPNTLLLPLLQVGVLFLGPMLMLLLDWCDAVMHTPLGELPYRCAQANPTDVRHPEFLHATLDQLLQAPLLMCLSK